MQLESTLTWRALWIKSLLRAFLPLALLALLSVIWLWRNERDQAISHLATRNELQLANLQQEVATVLTDSATDLMLLVNDPDLMQLAEQPPENWPQRAEHFLSLLRYKPVYDQIRMLDMQGRERARVNLNRGDPFVVPEAQLQDRRQSDYFTEAVGLSRGRIFLSALDLSRQYGRIEQPYKPVLRFATPLYDRQGVKRGVMVLNLQANQLLERLQTVGQANGGRLALLDQQGQWLLGGQGQDNFGLITGAGKGMAEREPALWKQLQQAANGWLRNDRGLWTYRSLLPSDPGGRADRVKLRLPFATGAASHSWLLLLHDDNDALQQAMAQPLRLSLLFGAGALALALLGAALLASQSVRGRSRLDRENVFLTLLEQAPLAVMVLDNESEGRYFNQQWQRLTGMQADLARGQGWWSLLGQADQHRLQAAISHFSEHGEHPPLELQLRLPDGQYRWVSCLFAARPGPMLRSIACILSFADIQASKAHEAQLADALQLVHGVLAGSGDPIVAVDQQLRVTLANPAFSQTFTKLYGDAPQPGDSLTAWLTQTGADRAGLLTQFSAALQGKHNQLRLQLGPVKRVFEASFAPLLDEQGELNGAILFARDITEMARIQNRVARSEELFRGVFSGSLDALFVMEAIKDEAGRIIDFSYLEVNQIGLTAIGARREQFVGKLQSEVYPIARELGYFERYVRVIESGEPYVEEVHIEHRGRKPGWYEDRVVPMGWGVILTSRDITDRKQAELALASSEALQRNIFDSSPYAIIATDEDGLISLFNKAAERLLGYEAADLIGQHSPVVFHDNTELARFAASLSEQTGQAVEPNGALFIQATKSGPLEREWTYYHRKGHPIPVWLTLSARLDAGGRVIGTMGIAYDISKQRTLESERDQLQAVVEILPDIVRMVNLDGEVTYLNAAGRRLWGLADDAPLTGMSLRDGYTDWSQQLLVNAAIPTALSKGVWQGETQWQMPDGRIIDFHQLMVAPRMHGQAPTFTATVLHDLSEIRAMEAKMVEEDVLLNSILESVQDAIVVVNEQGRVEALNPAVADLFGYGLHKVMGQPAAMLLPAALAERYKQAFQHYLATGEQGSQVIGQRIEVLGQRQDKVTFPLELTVSEIKLGNKRLFTWVMRDISERKTFEAKLLENIDELEMTQEALNAANQQLLLANMELGRMAQQDGLTGVANRRAFDERLQAEWSRAAREQHQLCVLMIDVDHFKKYNDGYGHQLGDECLRQVAACLKLALTRASDFVARYGGEEFVVLLPATHGQGGMEVAERIRQQLETAAIPHDFSPTSRQVTVSIGVAALVPLVGVDADYLVSAADQALYRAKEQGRARAVLAGG